MTTKWQPMQLLVAEDDLGLGMYPDSLTTGHSGKRSACSVIGYSKLNKPC